jgi:hypothetical protein
MPLALLLVGAGCTSLQRPASPTAVYARITFVAPTFVIEVASPAGLLVGIGDGVPEAEVPPGEVRVVYVCDISGHLPVRRETLLIVPSAGDYSASCGTAGQLEIESR